MDTSQSSHLQIVRSQLDGLACRCLTSPTTVTTFKNRDLSWTFEINAHNQMLQNVALLNDEHRRHFRLDVVKHYAR